MVLPLLHSVLPSAASSTYSTAGVDRCARCAAVSDSEAAPRYSPLDTANTMPLTTIGASGDVMVCDCHACASVGFPATGFTVKATMRAPFVSDEVVKIQRLPPSSWKVASAVPAPAAAIVASGVL